MILNRQSRVHINVAAVRAYTRRLRRALALNRRDFNVCFVGDCDIERLNAAYRGKRYPTDVLSFPWAEQDSIRSRTREAAPAALRREFASFLGDIVISAPTARRNARAARHSAADEIRWLILHGVLHLLGYDHETDHGEMTAFELALRERLGIG